MSVLINLVLHYTSVTALSFDVIIASWEWATRGHTSQMGQDMHSLDFRRGGLSLNLLPSSLSCHLLTKGYVTSVSGKIS